MDNEATATPKAAPVVEPVGRPGEGYIVHNPDGTSVATPAARKTLAQIRREELAATDVTTLAPAKGDPRFQIATWGRNDRAELRGRFARAKNGELSPSERELSDQDRFALVVLIFGVRDESGAEAFCEDDVFAYEKNSEDAEFLGDLFNAVIKANPLYFAPNDEKKTESPDSQPTP